MFKLIHSGEVYAPEYAGRCSVLLAGNKIARVGEVEAGKVSALDLGFESFDASGCLVMPGFVDPHEHIIGAGGEEGFSTRTPEVQVSELVRSGITTAVGLLGTDSTTRHLTSLLGKARQLEEDGITTYMYTGSFRVPPPTITSSVLDDIVIVDKVIGVGEIAISDFRSVAPSVHELARLVSEAILGGLVAGKAGVTHFHTGPGAGRLSILRDLLDEHDIPPKYVYPTHITRSAKLMDEAIALARRGCYVDIDTVEGDLVKWLRYYRRHDGPAEQLTVSSDAHTTTSASKLYEQFVSCAREEDLPLEQILPCFTANPAAALKLENKGHLREQMDADVLVVDKATMELVHVFANGRHMLKDGQVIVKGKYENLSSGEE